MSIDDTKLITITSKGKLDDIINTLARLQSCINSNFNFSISKAGLPLVFSNINTVHREDIKSGDKIKLVCTTNFELKNNKLNNTDSVNLVIEGVLRNHNFIYHTYSIDNYGYETIRFIPNKHSEFEDYFVTISIYNSMYGISISYKHENVWFIDDLTKKSNMTFKEAYDWMLLGYHISRPCFNNTYWYINPNSSIIEVNNGVTYSEKDISEVMKDISANDWMLV